MTEKYLNQGNEYNSRGMWEAAADQYNKVLRADPSNITAAEELSKMYRLMGKYDLAEKLCKRFLLLVPDNCHIHLQLAKVYRSQGKYDLYKKEIEKVSSKNKSLEEWLIRENEVRGFRKETAPYRVFFTWGMHHKCNYRCSYCYVPRVDRFDFPSLDSVMYGWKRVYGKYGRCRIRLDGGEPSIYPEFINLVKNLSNLHDLQINTNLSFDPDEFINEIKPRYIWIDASFHPEYVSLEEFSSKVAKLKNGNFKVVVSVVAYPPFIKDLEKYKRNFDKLNIPFILHPYSGECNGKIYPRNYDENEVGLIHRIDPASRIELIWRKERHVPGQV